jgi:LuxR family maltose regulon positive regulatory protein
VGSAMSELTKTECRIIALVADGRTNHEIAERLLMRPKTVEWNLTKIYRKLNVRTRTELAVMFVKTGRTL